MKTSLVLAWSFVRTQLVRSTITILTVMAATAIVLWVVGGYESLLRSYDKYSSLALGRYVLAVDPISRSADRHVPPDVVIQLRSDPRVAAADPMWAQRATLQVDADRREDSREHWILGTDALAPPFNLAEGNWVVPAEESSDNRIRTCLSIETAEWLRVGVGDEIAVGREGDGAQQLLVIGLVDNPPNPVDSYRAGSVQLPTPSIGGLYVDMQSAARIHKQPPSITFVGVELHETVDVHDFRYSWGPRLGQHDVPQQFQEDEDLEDQLDESATMSNVALQAYGATALSMLLAFLVIFNTLNMGVAERTRTFALLRAVALTREQVVAVILAEGLLLAGIGFLAGSVLGAGLMKTLEVAFPRDLHNGASLGALSLSLAASSTFGATLLAAIIPAWRATRVRPLDAIAPPRSGSEAAKPSWTWGLAAVTLIVLAPAVTIVFPPSFDSASIAATLVAYAALTAGGLILCPVLLRVADRLFAPFMARILKVEPLLLSDQLASKLWRNVGAALTLSLGLALLIAIQAWGFTMLETFVPGRWAPDATLLLQEPTEADAAERALTQTEGVHAADVLPFVVEQPRLREDLTGSAERASITRQDNVVIVGLDPERALAGDDPVLPLDWIRGSAQDAIPTIRDQHGCVVPEHFLQETGLDVGDTFELVPPESPEARVAYRIAGSVQLKGWHWQTRMTEMRVRTHRTAALVFANFADVRSDFALPGAKHAWLRTDAASSDLLATAKTHFGSESSIVTVHDVTGSVKSSANVYLWAISGMPIVVTAIASLGLLSLLLASVRARRWEFGVLRALGFTRGTLFRLVVAESLLIAWVAVVLSITIGMLAGWCGTGASATMSFFGGMKPILTVPWAAIFIGSTLLMMFAIGAASIPARSVVRTPTLRMLKAGRAAF